MYFALVNNIFPINKMVASLFYFILLEKNIISQDLFDVLLIKCELLSTAFLKKGDE